MVKPALDDTQGHKQTSEAGETEGESQKQYGQQSRNFFAGGSLLVPVGQCCPDLREAHI